MGTTEQKEGRPAERTLFGHPVGLANLFGVELWERFSFYGMLTILGYYLYYSLTEGGLELPKTTATGIVGAYGGLVYLSTVLGGWIADRLLGMERTVFYGGVDRRTDVARRVVVMCGHIALAIVLPGLARVAIAAGACRVRIRCVEGQRVIATGHPLWEGRCHLRRWFHPVLSRYQSRCLHRPTDHRLAADPRRVSLRIRCRCG